MFMLMVIVFVCNCFMCSSYYPVSKVYLPDSMTCRLEGQRWVCRGLAQPHFDGWKRRTKSDPPILGGGGSGGWGGYLRPLIPYSVRIFVGSSNVWLNEFVPNKTIIYSTRHRFHPITNAPRVFRSSDAPENYSFSWNQTPLTPPPHTPSYGSITPKL